MLRRRRVSERVSPGFIEVMKRKGNLAELKKKKRIFTVMFAKQAIISTAYLRA